MESKKQFENILGLSLLPLVFLVAWFFSLDGDLDGRWSSLVRYWTKDGEEFSIVLAVNLVIFAVAVFFGISALGFGRFGAKIGEFKLSSSKRNLFEKFRLALVGLGSAVVAIVLSKYFKLYASLFPLPPVVPAFQVRVFAAFLQLNVANLGVGVAVSVNAALEKIQKLRSGDIPPFPLAKNVLVLGTRMIDGREEWIVLGRNSLCTGIMLTAATGGGKSVACLGPWTKQIMTNFDPFPSICIIDPKDSFAKATLKMAGDLKLQGRVIHFTLDGRFKTNPIYRPEMLKNSGFMHVAGMIKAATVNFMGKEEGDQKFWGSKGSTLIKNLLVYCAAKYDGYFTLKDFYQEMIEVSERDFSTEIAEILSRVKFDWEEKRNLEIAGDYFEREFMNLDQKIKDSIAQTASSFLSQIREARIERVFCPPKEEINFWGFDEIVDEGKIFVFGIDVPGLSGPISVLMKLMYQRSVMDRILNRKRLETNRLAVSIFDEYQTFVSLGGGQIEGDDDYAAKRREALGATIIATQSHSSLLQATGDEVGTDVLIQNFRTRIVGNTTDIRTINHYKEIGGELEEEVETESFTESGQKPVKWLFGKGLMTSQPTVSQSVNKNFHRKPRINGEMLSRLKTFEAIGLVFNGVDAELIEKICLKPSFYPTMRVAHKKVIELARKAALAGICLAALKGQAFPSVCSVIKSPAFELCAEHVRSTCTCGFPPHPCTLHSYYEPASFVEVTTLPRMSFFKDLPGAASQLSTSKELPTSSGGEEMDGHFYHARILQVPFGSLAYSGMPCGGSPVEKPCFEAMSEHISTTWKSGVADSHQPLLLAWSANVPACLANGAISAVSTGRVVKGLPTGGATCSFPLEAPAFPPVTSEICNGWGVLLPRTGFVESNSIVSAALLAGERIRSIANEVYGSTAIFPDEKWQMIYPQSSSCFREGQTLGLLETVHGVNETGRMKSINQESFLFVVWKKVSCCSESTSIATAEAAKQAMKQMCQGVE